MSIDKLMRDVRSFLDEEEMEDADVSITEDSQRNSPRILVNVGESMNLSRVYSRLEDEYIISISDDDPYNLIVSGYRPEKEEKDSSLLVENNQEN